MTVTTVQIEQELRQRARAAWEEHQREVEAAERESREREAERLRKKCIDLLGAAPTQVNGRDGWIGSLHLRYKGDPYGSSYLSLIAECPFCGEEIESRPVSHLADLGRNLECLRSDHVCRSKVETGPDERFKQRLVNALMSLMSECALDEV